MKKILLVDDSSTIREEVSKSILSQNKEVELLEAENGVVGLKQITEHPDVALIFLDVNMPEMDGITMLKRLKSDHDMSNLNVVMLTTEASPDLKTTAKENGARAWLLKPFNDEKIKKVLDKLL